MNVPEALRAIETLLSDPGDLLSPDTGPGGLWEDGDENAPFWSEAGLYGRVGKEAARTILYRHRKATEALRVLRGASEDVPAALARPDLSPLPCPGRRRAMTPGADLATARKEAEASLADARKLINKWIVGLDRTPKADIAGHVIILCDALAALLAATPEPAPGDPEGEWTVVQGDQMNRTNPGSPMRCNSSGAWVVGPFHRSYMTARGDLPEPAPALPDEVREAAAKVRGHFKPNGLAYTPFGEDVLALLAVLAAHGGRS